MALPQLCLLSPQHTFCRRCALKSGRALLDSSLALFSSWEGNPSREVAAQTQHRPCLCLRGGFFLVLCCEW